MNDDNSSFGFGKFVPGFDFLQSLAKGASQAMPQLPGVASWIAPTLDVEELEKRIGDLRAVHFWLDQNSKALAATIQALEVQKMTLATLKGMNLSMGELAKAMQMKAAPAAAEPAGEAAHAGEAQDADAAQASGKRKPAASAVGGGGAGGAGGVVDPLQWWGALTQQFQQIAADAMKDAGRSGVVDAARNAATGAARDAMDTAARMMQPASPGTAAKPARKAAAKAGAGRKRATRKTAARKTSSR